MVLYNISNNSQYTKVLIWITLYESFTSNHPPKCIHTLTLYPSVRRKRAKCSNWNVSCAIIQQRIQRVKALISSCGLAPRPFWGILRELLNICFILKLHSAFLNYSFLYEHEYWNILSRLKLSNFPKKTSNKIMFLPLFC